MNTKRAMGLMRPLKSTIEAHRALRSFRAKQLNLSHDPLVMPVISLLNQEDTPSCVGHAGASAIESQLSLLGVYKPVSAIALWREARTLQSQRLDTDEGTLFSSLVEVLEYQGFENRDADEIGAVGKYSTQSPDEFLEAHDNILALKSAGVVFEHKVVNPADSDCADQVESALRDGYEVAIGTMVTQAFCELYTPPGGTPAVVGASLVGTERGVGGHEMRVFGVCYVGKNRVFLVVNSWGDTFGGCALPVGLSSAQIASIRPARKTTDGRRWAPGCFLLSEEALKGSWTIDLLRLRKAA